MWKHLHADDINLAAKLRFPRWIRQILPKFFRNFSSWMLSKKSPSNSLQKHQHLIAGDEMRTRRLLNKFWCTGSDTWMHWIGDKNGTGWLYNKRKTMHQQGSSIRWSRSDHVDHVKYRNIILATKPIFVMLERYWDDNIWAAIRNFHCVRCPAWKWFVWFGPVYDETCAKWPAPLSRIAPAWSPNGKNMFGQQPNHFCWTYCPSSSDTCNGTNVQVTNRSLNICHRHPTGNAHCTLQPHHHPVSVWCCHEQQSDSKQTLP